jgi:hypothetical protein
MKYRATVCYGLNRCESSSQEVCWTLRNLWRLFRELPHGPLQARAAVPLLRGMMRSRSTASGDHSNPSRGRWCRVHGNCQAARYLRRRSRQSRRAAHSIEGAADHRRGRPYSAQLRRVRHGGLKFVPGQDPEKAARYSAIWTRSPTSSSPPDAAIAKSRSSARRTSNSNQLVVGQIRDRQGDERYVQGV